MYYNRQGEEITLEEWGVLFSRDFQQKLVEQTDRDGVRVSTVWLGLDHSFILGGPPLIFETIIFGGVHDDYVDRYATEEQAIEGHKKACVLAFGEGYENQIS